MLFVKHVFLDCLSGDAQPQCSCQDGDGGVDSDPPIITFNSPVDGATYNDEDVLLDVSTNEMASSMKRAFDEESLRTLCGNCNHATMTKTRMGDGLHTVRVQAKDLAGNIAEEEISFIVDTKVPVIHAVMPGQNAYVASEPQEFKVVYTESSVQSIKLFYKKQGAAPYSFVIFSGCSNGETQECVGMVDLSSYSQGDVLNVYVQVTDVVNVAESSVMSLTVDDGLAELPFTIVSPSDGSVSNTRNVNFEFQAYVPTKEFLISKNGGAFTSICKNDCMHFTKAVSLVDGENEVTVRLIDTSSNEYEQSIHVFVDSKKPSIIKVSPTGGSKPIGDELFVVEYSELESTEEVILHYGVGDTNLAASRDDCPTGSKVSCEFDIDLSSFDGDQLQYYAEVRDRASSISSKLFSGLVDTTAPVMTMSLDVIDPVQDSSVQFDIEVSELVTLETSDNSGKFTSLCKNCQSYHKTRSFKDGMHSVLIRAVDAAGNMDSETLVFRVDSKVPKLSSLDLGDATNGEIILSYMELNPVEVVVHYRPIEGAGIQSSGESLICLADVLECSDGTYVARNPETCEFYDCPGKDHVEDMSILSEGWIETSFTHCEGSSKGTCLLDVDMSSLNSQEIELFVTMEDIREQVATTKVVHAEVDTVLPVVQLSEPGNGDSFDSRIPVIMTSNEKVTFEFSDNGGRFNRFCSNCVSFNKLRPLSNGAHTLVFLSYDPAGNTVEMVRTVNVF